MFWLIVVTGFDLDWLARMTSQHEGSAKSSARELPSSVYTHGTTRPSRDNACTAATTTARRFSHSTLLAHWTISVGKAGAGQRKPTAERYGACREEWDTRTPQEDGSAVLRCGQSWTVRGNEDSYRPRIADFCIGERASRCKTLGFEMSMGLSLSLAYSLRQLPPNRMAAGQSSPARVWT